MSDRALETDDNEAKVDERGIRDADDCPCPCDTSTSLGLEDS